MWDRGEMCWQPLPVGCIYIQVRFTSCPCFAAGHISCHLQAPWDLQAGSYQLCLPTKFISEPSCGFSLLLYCPRVLEPSLSLSVGKMGTRLCTDPLGTEAPSLISVKSRQMEQCGLSAARGVHAGSESARTQPGQGAPT